MKIRHSDIVIEKENPFINCKLNRQPYAEILTNIVESYPDGFVLAINNEWGTGKTTFVKMWQKHLINKGFNTIYFNAWENDFTQNPIVAIMSELKSLTNASTKELYQSILQKGAVLSKHILPALIKALSKKYFIDTDIVVDTIENSVTGAVEILEDEIKEYVNKKQTIKEFREELEKFVEGMNNNKPLVFIIDELDRCRPSYSVELLEQMKHFFAVNGIVFILSIDKIQLGHAIRGVYGNDRIDSEEYLRRFIDLEYSLPFPSIENFCKYLYEYYSFDNIFQERRQFSEFQSDRESLIKISTMLFMKNHSTLRQQEKIYGFTRLVLSSFEYNQFIFPELLFILIYLKTTQSELYAEIKSCSLSLQELSDKFYKIIPHDLQKSYNINLLYIEAMLLHFYNNQRDYNLKEKLIDIDENRNPITHIKSKFEDNSNRSSLIQCLSHINSQFNYSDFNLSLLLKRIDLMEPIKI